jgi:hypothetical protein
VHSVHLRLNGCSSTISKTSEEAKKPRPLSRPGGGYIV